MNSDLEKLLWVICDGIGLGLVSYNWYFMAIFSPFLLYQGAYFRGKNWILGWEKVKLLGVNVKTKSR